MYERAISAPTSPTRLSHSGKRSWEEPNWMGSPRLLNKDMKTGLSRSLQTLPSDASAFDTGEEKAVAPLGLLSGLSVLRVPSANASRAHVCQTLC